MVARKKNATILLEINHVRIVAHFLRRARFVSFEWADCSSPTCSSCKDKIIVSRAIFPVFSRLPTCLRTSTKFRSTLLSRAEFAALIFPATCSTSCRWKKNSRITFLISPFDEIAVLQSTSSSGDKSNRYETIFCNYLSRLYRIKWNSSIK